MVSEVQEFCLRWNNHHTVLVSVLDSLLERETLVDVILAAEGQFIKVHRLVLCACSQYFEDLLSQQCDKQAVVFLKDVRFIDLKALVDYMYRGEVNVSQDQLAAFLSTAESLRIKGLADKDDHAKSSALSRTEKPIQMKSRERKRLRNKTSPQVVTPTSKRRLDSPEVVESPSPPPSVAPQPALDALIDSVDFEDSEQVAEADSDDHFIAVEPKLENDIETDMTADQLESTDNWSTKETEEDWSNSEAHSAASPPDGGSGNNSGRETNSKESHAGPSNQKGKSSNSATSRGSVTRYSCSRCGRTYKHRSHCTAHLRYECGQPRFECPVPLCNFRTRREREVKYHLSRNHAHLYLNELSAPAATSASATASSPSPPPASVPTPLNSSS